MNDSYDEDLSCNQFFVDLQNGYAEEFRHAAASGWVVCVPRAGSLRAVERSDALAHVLVPDDELPGARYFSLTGTRLVVADGLIAVDSGPSQPTMQIRIVFEETFYTKDDLKYKVWCIERPLNRPCEFKSEADTFYVISTLKDCVDFLWTESDGRQVLENVDVLMKQFKSRLINGDVNLNDLQINVEKLYRNCLRCAFNNVRLKENAKMNRHFKKNVKLAVETYMHYGIHDELFDAILSCTAQDDANLNKIIRNLADFQLRDLEISDKFVHCIPVAKMCLSQIAKFKTILGKTTCLKNTITTVKKKNREPDSGENYITPDELLPLIIFLVIKSGLPNWHAQLCFMKCFRFSENCIQTDETAYAISTLEAVIDHLKSETLHKISTQECYRPDGISDGDRVDSLNNLFEQVRLSNYETVKKLLAQKRNKNELEYNCDTKLTRLSDCRGPVSIEEILSVDLNNLSKLCHPLCSCPHCCNILSKGETTFPSIFSRNDRGLTVLHAACIYNKPQMVDLILELGADVDAADCNGFAPLHYAASKGHQNALLQLLHAYADINKENLEKNSPIHLATNNGHESCVKAIIYFTENSKITININGKNDNGDTPLHLASKWGYETIARLLIEYGADPWQQNNKGKSSVDIAHSSIMLKLLQSSGACLSEYVNIINVTKNTARIVDYKNKKSNTTVLNLPDEQEFKTESSSSSQKSRSTHSIKEMERLFRAITYGDVKLACFYMGIDVNNTEDVETEPSAQKYCHPLCLCEKCKIPHKALAAKFNTNTCDLNGNTALHVATKHGRFEICKILLCNKASADIQNKCGYTPIHIAANERKTSIGKMLVEHGCNLNLKDFNGNTPLHSACISGNEEIVKSIINRGDFTHTYNFRGKTPLDEAKDKMFLTIMALFEDSGIS